MAVPMQGPAVVGAKPVGEEDELAELERLSRPGGPAPAVSYITPEEELALNELSVAPKPEPTAGEISAAYTQGAAKETAKLVAGTTGFSVGFKAGAPLVGPAAMLMGPAAPLIPLITGAAGAVAGYQGVKTLADSIVEDPSPEDISYPAFSAGQTFGGAIALAPLAFAIPATLADKWGKVGPFLARIGEGARKYPKSYMLGETTAGLSSSVGTYIAETEFPGDVGKRFALEVGFGLFDPARFLPLATSKGIDVLKTGLSLRTAGGREAFAASRSQANMDRATQRLLTIFEQYGEDVPELIKRLESPLVGGPEVAYPPAGSLERRTGPTSAQKTGSLVLTQMEAALSALDPKFAADVTDQGKQALKAYSLILSNLNQVGSPSALRAAAVLRRDFFDNAVEARLNRAMVRAREKIDRFKEDTPETRVQIARIIRDEVELALANAREAERAFWLEAKNQATAPVGTKRVTEVIPSSRELTQAYEERANKVLADMKDIQRRYGKVSLNDARQVSRITGEKAKSFSQYIKETIGGIAIDSEWRARDLNGRTRPGLFLADTPENRSRAGMDALREAAFDGGYFLGKTDYNEITDEEIFDAIASDTPTSRFWQASVREKLAGIQDEQDYLFRMDVESGIRPDMSPKDIASRLRAIDEARLAEGREDLFVPSVKQRTVTRTVDIPNRLAPSNAVNAYLERASEVAPAFLNDLVPSNVQNWMADLGVTKEAINAFKSGGKKLPTGSIKQLPVEEIIKTRSDILDLARQAKARGDVEQASFYNKLQSALLDDLSTLPGSAYDSARDFSRSLNDAFTRTFANDLLAKTGTGADKIPVETLLSTAFGGGADRVALRMRQIETAVGFLKNQLNEEILSGLSDPKAAERLRELSSLSDAGIVSIQDAQRRVLRLAATKALRTDPATGVQRVNPVQLNKFITENKPLLDQMGLTGELQDAQQAENLLAAVIDQNSFLNKRVRSQTAFSQVLGRESPTLVIADALSTSNPNPTRSMRRLANFARKAGPDALQGLKASIYDYVATKASGGTSVIDGQLYYDAFFKRYAVDQPALADVLLNSGVMSADEIKNIRVMANQMRAVEDVLDNRRKLENFLQGADVVGELAMRVIGSKIGTAAASGGPGSLIAASAGSKAVRQIFDQMPMMAVRNLIQQAAQDPQFMAQLLKRGMSEREKLIFARRMHAYLLASGFNYATYKEPPPEAPAQAPRASDQLQNLQDVYDRMRGRPMPPAPTTRGVPGMPSTGGPPPAGGGAPPTSQSRMMLQQLFPNDEIMGAAALQAGMPPTPG